jgi:hypothetical protein
MHELMIVPVAIVSTFSRGTQLLIKIYLRRVVSVNTGLYTRGRVPLRMRGIDSTLDVRGFMHWALFHFEALCTGPGSIPGAFMRRAFFHFEIPGLYALGIVPL